MKQIIAIPAIIFTIGVACLSNASAGPITYYVDPVTLSGASGYRIEGGHITVSGMTEALDVADILDYEVHVSGPMPLTFASRNPIAHVDLWGSVSATAAVISVNDVDPDPVRGWSLLELVEGKAHEDRWSLTWGCHHPPLPHQAVWLFRGLGVEANRMGWWDSERPGPLVVARVPEPLAVMLLLLSTSVVGVFAWRNRDSANYS